MRIPFRVKLLTDTAKLPDRNRESDLWDLFADGFCGDNLKDLHYKEEAMYNYDITHKENLNFENHLDCFDRNHLPDDLPNECKLYPQGRILVKTGIALELPKLIKSLTYKSRWFFDDIFDIEDIEAYAVADLRPRSGLALKHGITVLNSPATIDNSYRKEIGVILINHGHEPFCLTKGMKIAQMLIRPLYPSSIEVVDSINETNRGAYGSTGV